MARSPTTSDAFNAVAEPRRRHILDLLAQGERPVNDLVGSLGMAQPQVSKHLRSLAASGTGERARVGPAKALQFERRAPQGNLRLGPGLRAVLGSPARPDQAERRAESQGAKIRASHIRLVRHAARHHRGAGPTPRRSCAHAAMPSMLPSTTFCARPSAPEVNKAHCSTFTSDRRGQLHRA